jgi:cytochrome P450
MAGERQAHPRDDLISDLVTIRDMGDRLTHDEIVTLVAGLGGTGSETTALPRRHCLSSLSARMPGTTRAGVPIAGPVRYANER